jgi:hypothetical protein
MIRKLDNAWIKEPCRHPEHNPPSMICLPPGTYEHTCPGCGNKIVFIVDGCFMHSSPIVRAGWSLGK